MKRLNDANGVKSEYLELLKSRSKASRIYKFHQFIGLKIAEILDDKKHNSLYIKLAKNSNPEELLLLAKETAERKNIKNKGAYFMKLLQLNKRKKLKA